MCHIARVSAFMRAVLTLLRRAQHCDVYRCPRWLLAACIGPSTHSGKAILEGDFWHFFGT